MMVSMAIGISFALAIMGMGMAVGKDVGGYTSAILNSTVLPGRYLNQTMKSEGIHIIGEAQ